MQKKEAQQYREIPSANHGSTWSIMNEFMMSQPEFLLKLARSYGPIVKFRFAQLSFVIVSDPDMVRELLVTKAKIFPKMDRDIKILSRFIGEGLVTTVGDQHKKQRKLAQPAFHARRIGNYADTMVDYTVDLTDEWRPGTKRDISEDMMSLTMYIVAKTLFDADKDEMKETAERVGDAMHVLQGVSNRDFQRAVQWPEWLPTRDNRVRRKARRVLNDTMATLVDQRIAESASGDIEDRGDLLSMLMLAEDENGEKLSRKELLDQLVTLFAAGHETTSNALTWTWYLLSQHPEIEAQFHAEIDSVLGGRAPEMADVRHLPFTEMVIKESMRLYPPAWTLNLRTASEDTTLGDFAVPAGSHVFATPYVIHRLEQHFEDPDSFRPERFLPEKEKEMHRYSYLPFGGGPRVCIGNSFAMMEAILIMATVAQRYRLVLDSEQKIELNPQVTMSNMTGMHMWVEPRDVPTAMSQITAEKNKIVEMA